MLEIGTRTKFDDPPAKDRDRAGWERGVLLRGALEGLDKNAKLRGKSAFIIGVCLPDIQCASSALSRGDTKLL